MSRRSTAAAVVVLAVTLAASWGVSRLLDRRARAVAERFVVPAGDWTVVVAAADLGGAVARLTDRPVWSRLLSPLRRAPLPSGSAGVAACAPGAWSARVGTLSFGDPARDSMDTIEVPERATRVRLGIGALARSRRGDSVAGLLAPRLPERLEGEIDAAGDRWRLRCEPPCPLSLAGDGDEALASAGWAAIPPDAPAAAWLRVDPRGLASAIRGTPIERAERALGVPLVEELAASARGTAVAALLEEPREGGPPRLVVAVDLADPARASAALDRFLALGLISGGADASRYRGTTIGRLAGSSAGAPSFVVDGSLLLAALRPADLEEAIDRLRRGAGRSRDPLFEAGIPRDASWAARSRSPGLASLWGDLLTGRAAPRDARPVRGVAWAIPDRAGGIVIEGRGDLPAFANDPVLPSAGGFLRAAAGLD